MVINTLLGTRVITFNTIDKDHSFEGLMYNVHYTTLHYSIVSIIQSYYTAIRAMKTI